MRRWPAVGGAWLVAGVLLLQGLLPGVSVARADAPWTVEDGTPLLTDGNWPCVSPEASVSGNTLNFSLMDDWHGGLNALGPRLRLGDGGFGVRSHLAPGLDSAVGMTLTGALGDEVDWWRGMKLLEVGLQGSTAYLSYRLGDKPDVNFWTSWPRAGWGAATLEVRVAQGQIQVLDDGSLVGTVADPGLFPAGTAYLGFTIAPDNTLSVSDLQLLATRPDQVRIEPDGQDPLNGARPDALRSLAARKDKRIGVVLSDGLIWSVPDAARQVATQFDEVGESWSMRFATLHPDGPAFDFCGADRLVRFARAQGMLVHGPTLAETDNLPDWLTDGEMSRDEAMAVLHAHISGVVGHFRGQVQAWTVVSHALNWDGTPRPNIWSRAIGPEWVTLAFRWAHEADPNAELFYEDDIGPGGAAHAAAVQTTLAQWKASGVPVDAFSGTAWLDTQRAPTASDVGQQLHTIAAAGVRTRIGPIWVGLGSESATAPVQALGHQASDYGALAAACVAEPSCESVVLIAARDDPPGPGDPAAALFDVHGQPKLAFGAVQLALGG